MAITDLTGTTWEFNNTVSSSGLTAGALTFVSRGHTWAYISATGYGLQYKIGKMDPDPAVAYVFSTSSWTDVAYKRIEITGGTLATNSSFISWLQTNATQIVAPPSAGTNLKVKVNGAWKDGTLKVKVSGAWKDATAMYAKISGEWFTSITDDVTKPLTFTAVDGSGTVSFRTYTNSIQYSIDKGSTYSNYTSGTAITLTTGQSVMFKNAGSSWDGAGAGSNDCPQFSITGNIAASNNIMSLCDGTNFASITTLPMRECFICLFEKCTTLLRAPMLPATVMTPRGYYYMFQGCTSLITAPELPATTLDRQCYQAMFQGCTSLITAPELPATTVSSHSYSYMFKGCTSLTTVAQMPATINNPNTDWVCVSMYQNCTSLVNIKIPNLSYYQSSMLAEHMYTNISPNFVITAEPTKLLGSIFSDTSSLTTVNLPDSITYIGNGVFANCGRGSISIYTTKQSVADLINADTFMGISYWEDIEMTAYVYLNGSLYKTVTYVPECFVRGTLITLADGSQKNIEDITYNDELKVWDFDEGCFNTANICWLTRPGLMNNHYYKLTFSDGTVLKTTGRNSNHKVYNVDERYFKGVNVTEVGDRIFSTNGIVTVTDKEYIEELVEYYNLMTTKKINCFANGILTSDRYGNLYPIDENMVYIKEGREIRPYSEFEAVGISRYWYDTLRLGEVTGTIEETRKYIDKIEAIMLPLPEHGENDE